MTEDRQDPTPVALYARVSSDRQDVDLSVAAQLRALRDYAEKNGYVVTREYVDEAESGPTRRAMLAERRVLLDSAETIAAFAEEMSEFLRTSEITETRAFVRSFVKAILVGPGRATIHYTIPTPPDSPIDGADAADVALSSRVMSTVRGGGACGIRTRDLRLERAVSWATRRMRRRAQSA